MPHVSAQREAYTVGTSGLAAGRTERCTRGACCTVRDRPLLDHDQEQIDSRWVSLEAHLARGWAERPRQRAQLLWRAIVWVPICEVRQHMAVGTVLGHVADDQRAAVAQGAVQHREQRREAAIRE